MNAISTFSDVLFKYFCSFDKTEIVRLENFAHFVDFIGIIALICKIVRVEILLVVAYSYVFIIGDFCKFIIKLVEARQVKTNRTITFELNIKLIIMYTVKDFPAIVIIDQYGENLDEKR